MLIGTRPKGKRAREEKGVGGGGVRSGRSLEHLPLRSLRRSYVLFFCFLSARLPGLPCISMPLDVWNFLCLGGPRPAPLTHHVKKAPQCHLLIDAICSGRLAVFMLYHNKIVTFSRSTILFCYETHNILWNSIIQIECEEYFTKQWQSHVTLLSK